MRFALALAVGLLAWSLIANLVIGDAFYVSRNLALTGVLLALARGCRLDPSSLGLARDRLGAGARWGVASLVVVAVVVGLGVLLADRIGLVALLLSDARAELPAGEVAYQALVRIPLGTAVFEEVAFRGVLFAAFLRVLGPVWHAVAWSSVVFGLWHIPAAIVTLELNGVEPFGAVGVSSIIGTVVLTAIAGVAFAALRVWSRSLLAPVLAHAATNSFGLAAAAWTGAGGDV